MKAIRRTDTRPERELRSALHKNGYRFRKDLRLALGPSAVRPDIVLPRRKIAVFVDGCFWHSCPIHGRTPITNGDYWGPKLARTCARDSAANETLIAAGWQVIRVWEHASIETSLTTFEHVFEYSLSVSPSGERRGTLEIVN